MLCNATYVCTYIHYALTTIHGLIFPASVHPSLYCTGASGPVVQGGAAAVAAGHESIGESM